MSKARSSAAYYLKGMQLIKENPERFIELAHIIRKDYDLWLRSSQQLHTEQPTP